MATRLSSYGPLFWRSVSFKNVLLFLLILIVALVPLALRYYQDSREYEIQNLASKLEFFAERGASWLDAAAISSFAQPEHMRTPEYRNLVRTLNRIEQEFSVDNAIVMRRGADERYTFVASGDGSASPGQASDDAVRNPCNQDVGPDNTVSNPCNPALASQDAVSNPCNPALADRSAVSNPCNPALANRDAVSNPCNPALANRDAVSNPCNPALANRDAVSNPCNPALANRDAVSNPCNPDLASDSAVSNPCAATAGTNRFAIGQPVHIHKWFPATYKATNDTWLRGEMMHSQLFGGEVDGQQFDQFLQINTPLKLNGNVIAILMLNKFANPVAAAVRAKTFRVVGLTVGILIIGLGLFGYSSARMLRPLKNLTTAAGEVAQGNLDITIPAPRHQDEVGRLTATFDTMIDGLRQRDFIRDTFGRYLSKEVVEEVLGSPNGLKLGGEMREVTILVSDLRGFTSLAEHLSPHQVIDILNRYLERMVDIITKYRGTVDEFQGDGILAFFGAPLAAEDDRERAIACAVEMQTALREINADQRQRQLPELNMGIGINTGEVIVGNIGSEKRTKYGAVGSAINAAYRIESYTIGGQILISPSVYEGVQSLVCVQSTQEVQFKGLDHAVTLYDVVGLQGQYASMLPEKTPETVVTLALPLPIAYFPVEGKTVSDQAIPGTITHLAASSAEATLEGQVTLHSNIKLRLAAQEESELSEVYAKITELSPGDGTVSSTHVCLGFTSLPEDAKAFLEQQRAAALQDEHVPTS